MNKVVIPTNDMNITEAEMEKLVDVMCERVQNMWFANNRHHIYEWIKGDEITFEGRNATTSVYFYFSFCINDFREIIGGFRRDEKQKEGE